jgi:hypothetical protein
MKAQYLIASIALLGASAVASAATQNSVQSPARPYGLDIASPVYTGGSDADSAKFKTNTMPGMLHLVNVSLEEYSYKNDKALEAIAYDPTKLKLAYETTARVYFLGEGAGYLNSLGYATTGGSPLSPGAELIFPNGSSAVGPVSSNSGTRSSGEPLLPGDFADLGTFAAGTQFDFFLIAQGANGGSQFFSTINSLNSDGLVHVVSLAYPGSPYLIIGFEDITGGGDRDYNDIVFVMDIGVENISKLSRLGAPEPSLAAGGLLAAVSMLGFSRRRKI